MSNLYETDAFREWFAANVTGNHRTYYSYKSYLGNLDRALEGGLDAAFDREGAEGLLQWARHASDPPFDKYASNHRSVLKCYVRFRIDHELPSCAITEETIATPSEAASVFQLEQQMQAAVREQLPALEAGLVAVDDGLEQIVSTGRIDILGRDANQRLVVIELKAGRCPSSALEQALGYAQSLHEERGESPRVLLIASEFTERTRAAAKRIPDLSLITYQFSLKFQPAG